MESVKVNEDSYLSFPELFDGANKWAGTETPDRPITVSERGLKNLIKLVGDAQEFVMAQLNETPECMKRNGAVELLNGLCAVWCEGDLIVSGLFLDKQGRVLMNDIEK